MKKIFCLGILGLMTGAIVTGCSNDEFTPTKGDAEIAKSQDNANATPSKSRLEAGKESGPQQAKQMDLPK